jgi:hypothetical protein
MMPVQRIYCPGDHGGRSCGADLFPRVWAASKRPWEHNPGSGWEVVRVQCATCGNWVIVNVRWLVKPAIVDANAMAEGGK